MLWLLLSTIAYLVGFLFLLLTVCFWFIRPFKVSAKVPGPKRHWLLGVGFGEKDDFFDDGGVVFDWGHWPTLSLQTSRRYNFQTWGGPTLNIGFGGAFFNVVSPESIQYILNTNVNNYVKGKLSKSFNEIIGQTAFSTDGDVWKFHRKITVSIVNREAVQYTSRILNQKLLRLEQYLKTYEARQIVDIQELSYKLILDVLLKWAFGIEVDQFNEDMESNGHTDDGNTFQQQHIAQVIDAFDKLQLYTHERFNDLFWEIKQKYCLGERERNVKQCTAMLDDFCFELIKETKRQQKQDDNQQQHRREDIISRYIRYTEKEDVPYSDKELRDFCMGFLLAGRDTTSASIAWCIYELTKHPNWILALREEVDEICGKDENNASKFTMESIQRMKVVNAIVYETLRLHSPAPDNYRFAVHDDILPDGTEIPAKSLIMFSPYTINHSEQVWGENADDYDPSRWLQITTGGEPSPSKFPTFGLGPRMCPGKNLGLMEIKMTISFLVSKFDFVDEAGHDGDYEWKLVMSMKDGFHVRVSTRI